MEVENLLVLVSTLYAKQLPNLHPKGSWTSSWPFPWQPQSSSGLFHIVIGVAPKSISGQYQEISKTSLNGPRVVVNHLTIFSLHGTFKSPLFCLEIFIQFVRPLTDNTNVK